MARRGQRLGLLVGAAGTIAAAVVALMLVIGLRQELAGVQEALASRATELGDLRAQVAALDAQMRDAGPVAALEQRVSVLEAAAPDVSRPEQGLTARRFALVDDRGQELAVLGVDQVGFPELRLVRGSSPAHAAELRLGWTRHSPALRILDAAGNAPVFVGVTDDGPALTLNAPDDSRVGASLQVDAQGVSTLALTDQRGTPRAALQLDADGFPTLVLTDQHGASRAAFVFSPAAGADAPSLSLSRLTVRGREGLSLGFDADGPQVVLSNLDDTPRIRLGFAEGRPAISVHDATAAPRVEMAETEAIVGLRLNDAAGRERAALVSTQDTSVLRLNDAAQIRTALVSTPDSTGLVLNDAQASPRTLLSFSEENGPELTFLDEHGGKRAAFIAADTGGTLGFFDDQGTLRMLLNSLDAGGVLAFFDEHETTRVSLLSWSDRGALAFHDEHETVRAELASSPAGPALSLHDAQGTVRAALSAGTSGGVGLNLHDPQGALAGSFTVSETGRLLGLYDGEDARNVALAITASGAGLDLTDAQGAGRVHLGVVDDDPALILTDEDQEPRVIAGFDSNTLAPIFLTRDAAGNETWRSGPAAGPQSPGSSASAGT